MGFEKVLIIFVVAVLLIALVLLLIERHRANQEYTGRQFHVGFPSWPPEKNWHDIED